MSENETTSISRYLINWTAGIYSIEIVEKFQNTQFVSINTCGAISLQNTKDLPVNFVLIVGF